MKTGPIINAAERAKKIAQNEYIILQKRKHIFFAFSIRVNLRGPIAR